MSDCPYIKRISEYDGDTEDRCGLVPGLSCWGPGATQCPLKGEKMSKLKPCPREAEALEIIETMLDVADMKNMGPIYADDPPRSGLCRIPEEDAAILRQYIADRRAQPANEPLTCDGCVNKGQYENEVEYGYPSPCTRCKRRSTDNYRHPPERSELCETP